MAVTSAPWNRQREIDRSGSTSHLATKPAFDTDASRWTAVEQRDPAADGIFYYAVRTTGVYCRPSCAARRPRRATSSSIPTWADAERAGFRACRRCHPKRAAESEPHAAARHRCLPANRGGRKAAQPCRAGRGGRAEPLAFSTRLQTGYRRHAKSLRRPASGPANARSGLGGTRSATRAIFAAGFGSTGRFYEKSSQLLG